MTEPLDLDAIRARAEAATDGPWTSRHNQNDEGDWRDADILHEYTTPSGRIWANQILAHTDLDPADAEFIAHAREDVPDLVAEVERLRESQRAFAETLDFGNDRTEPAATLEQMVEPVQQAMQDAHEHIDCPAVCEYCGERLASERCGPCFGSGTDLSSEGVLEYRECEWCTGTGRVHAGCVEESYDDLAAEVERLRNDPGHWAHEAIASQDAALTAEINKAVRYGKNQADRAEKAEAEAERLRNDLEFLLGELQADYDLEQGNYRDFDDVESLIRHLKGGTDD